jgi:hypothetical protein
VRLIQYIALCAPVCRSIRHTIILDDPFEDPPQLAELIPPQSPQPQFEQVGFLSSVFAKAFWSPLGRHPVATGGDIGLFGDPNLPRGVATWATMGMCILAGASPNPVLSAGPHHARKFAWHCPHELWQTLGTSSQGLSRGRQLQSSVNQQNGNNQPHKAHSSSASYTARAKAP